MSLIATLTEKSWETPGLDAAAIARDDREGPFDPGIFIGVFLCVVAVIFLLVTSAYFMRMGVHGPIGHGAGDWGAITEPPLLWVNTAVLIVSSLAFHAAQTGAHRNRSFLLRFGLLAGGALGILFLVGQVTLWRQLAESGYFLALHSGICTVSGDPLTAPANQFLSGNPAIAFLYLITGLHGVHIIGGLVAWGVTAQRAFAAAVPMAVERSVTLCARYWHFLLLVWLAMFGLMLMT
ncbi:cytochrome-c oxidase [Sphingomonas sp. DBB INV C78]|uniref:cytochrome c oxidase subunit 3 n=1 Tax=Sphingomonas sp. DBB INV C78 TaxID=3349434 RepID=UPI0036D303B9